MIVDCHNCMGIGFDGDFKCKVCLGDRVLDTEAVCECGRPAVRWAGAMMVCSEEECYTLAMKSQDFANKEGKSWTDGYGV